MKNLKEDLWMTKFYGKNWYIVDSPNFEVPKGESSLLEWRINSSEPRLLQKSFELGFELVETLIEFETTVHDQTKIYSKNLRRAEDSDLAEILNLVNECFTLNPKFYNRLKNEKYFSHIQSAEYFQKSVENFFSDSSSITVVSEVKGKVVGYYLMRLLSNGKYKGVSAGVQHSMRGRELHIQMQQKISEIIDRPYDVINTTQISNYPVINNHIKQKKKLTKIEHILYRKNNLN